MPTIPQVKQITHPSDRPHFSWVSRLGLSIALSWMLSTALMSQAVYISEIVASNDDSHLDEDGDSSDWIELYNSSDSAVSLTGWHLTDDASNLTQWTFPVTTIPAESFIIIFASDKNRALAGQELHTNFKLSASGEYLALVKADGTTIENDHTFGEQVEDLSYGYTFNGGSPTVLLDAGANCTALVPTSSTDASGWQALSFSDSGWLSGTTGVGYENDTGYQNLIGLDVYDEMFEENATVYIRVPFTANDTAIITDLTLKMKYDDGFIAYINGVKVAESSNAPESPTWNSQASGNHSDSQAIIFQEYDIDDHIGALQEGNNILAIHGLNRPADSSDMIIVPRIEAAYATSINSSEVGTLASPTPAGANSILGYAGFVEEDITASPARGFYDTSLSVTLTNATVGAEIRYTTDGSEPTTSSTLYTGPITISTTTTLRSKAFVTDWKPSPSRTDTYIFAADVATQAKTTDDINGQALTYGMDADVLAKTYYDASNQLITVEDSLKAIPSISLTTDYDNLYDPTIGIYVNPSESWEVPASAELIHPDGTEGFQINAGLRIRGGASRNKNNPKHSFRLFFRSDYGPSKLKYALFEDEGADEFDKVDLRSAQNYSWSKDNSNRNTFLRDIFARDSAADMGQAYTRSRYYHLYVNGEYWGLFMTEERPTASFSESYLGGDKDDYDAIKTISSRFPDSYSIEATDGNTDAYERLYNAAMAGFSNNADYFSVMGLDANGNPDPTEEKLLDVDNLIDYLLVIYYTAASDNSISWFIDRFGRLNNMYAVYNRVNPDGFKWIQHDSEHSLDTNRQLDMTGPFTNSNFTLLKYFNPMTLHEKLSVNEEYKVKFSDRVYKHLQNEGVMTLANSEARLDYRAAQIDRAIVANAARWGSTSLDRDTWVSAVATTRAWLARSEERCTEVFGYLDADGLMPSTQPPMLSHRGGLVDPSTTIQLTESDPYQSPTSLPSTPYGGSPHAVPGLIEAEDFDNGGQNVGYYDTGSGNNGNEYRTTEDVDIEVCDEGGYNVGWVSTGEWMKYTVDVASAGDYEIRVRVALRSDNGSAYHIEVDGIDVTGSIPVASTGGWQNWSDSTSSIGLAAREQVISIVIESGGPNINSIDFVALGTNDLTITVPTDPSPPTEPEEITYTMYYTTDGTDPRAIGGGIVGSAYSSPISITRPTHLKARTLSSEGEWSALAEATYWTDAIPLAITELMYHAPEGNSHDLIEVQNISDESVTLKGYKLDNGIEFKFKNSAFTTLAAGEFMVVVDDIDAFNEKYPNSDSVLVAGEFSGDLSNGGEEIDLEFRGEDLVTFNYDDARNWPQAADGAGHSLVPLERAMDTQESGSLDYGGNWRASTNRGGSPGEADPEPSTTVVINEVWAHTDSISAESNDKIELYNHSESTVFLTGWYLSDSLSDTQQWLIPDTFIPAGGFIVFDETDFHPSEVEGFGLNKAGEQVVLSQGDRIVDVVRFKGQENSSTGVTWGRYPDGNGDWMMTVPTHAAANQLVTPTLRISEVMFNPTQEGNDYEYIIIENVGSSAHNLRNDTGSYRIDGGVSFTFPAGRYSLPAGERLWILSFDPIDTVRLNQFCAAYGLNAEDETFFGGYSGSLSNRGERVALERPQDSDDPLNPLDISWVVVDELFYFDQAPWPSGADGTGYPLLRTGPLTWGAPSANDSDADRIDDSWETLYFSGDTTPTEDPDGDGQNNLDEFIGGTNPTDVNSYFKVQSFTVPTLVWNSIPDRKYTIYRTDDLTQPFQEISTVTSSPFIDTEINGSQPAYFYKVKASLED